MKPFNPSCARVRGRILIRWSANLAAWIAMGWMLYADPAPVHAESLLQHTNPRIDDTNHLLADRLVQIAESIRYQGAADVNPSGTNAVAALRAVVELALEVAPDDPDLIRRAAIAAEAMNDRARSTELRRRLVSIDRADEVSVLRVIAARLDSIDSAEDRLSLLERFLGPDGRVLDDSVRSRLALEAALLHYEQGEEAKSIDKLLGALRLDASNDAAAEALVRYRLASDSVEQLIDAMTAAVESSPMDPAPAFRLATTLSSLGAYDAARTAIENAEVIHRISRRVVPIEIASVKSMIVAVTESPENAAAYLTEYQNDLSDREEARLLQEWTDYDEARQSASPEELPALQPPPVPLEDVADIRVDLPRSLQVLRLTLLEWGARPDEADRQLARLARTWQGEEAKLRDEIETAGSALAEALQVELAQLLHERLSVRLMVRDLVDEDQQYFDRTVEQDLNELATMLETADRFLDPFRAWIAFREGRSGEAIDAWRADDPIDPQSRIGIGMAYEATERDELALREYLVIADEAPGTLPGIAAEIAVERLRGHRRAEAESLQPITDRVNRTLQRARSTILADHASLEARIINAPNNAILDPLTPVELTIELTNRSPIPLAIGRGGSYETSVIIRPRVASLDAAQPASESIELPIETCFIDRVISLAPDESVLLPIRVRRSLAGIAIDDSAISTLCRLDVIAELRLFGRVIQDRIPLDEVEKSAASIALQPSRLKNGEPRAINSGESRPNFEAILLLGRAMRDTRTGAQRLPVDAMPDVEWIDVSLSYLTSNWKNMSDPLRAWCLLAIPSANRSTDAEKLARFESAASNDLDRLSATAWVLTRVETISDPILQRALSSEDERIGDVAEYVASFLRSIGEVESSQIK